MRFLWRGRLRRDTLLQLVAQAFYRLSGFVLLMVLSRCLPARDIGAYFFAVAFAESFTVLANFSLNSVMMRRVAANPAQASAHLAPLLGFRLASSPVYLLCVSVAAVAFTSASWPVIVVAALFTLLENTYFCFGAFFLTLRKIVHHVTIGVSVQLLFLIPGESSLAATYLLAFAAFCAQVVCH